MLCVKEQETDNINKKHAFYCNQRDLNLSTIIKKNI